MNERRDFYQDHLNRVSRSFAFCIERLQDELREQVGLAYLVCRVLDTVEDAPWQDVEAQRAHFLEFNEFVRETPSPAAVRAWAESFPVGVNEDEQRLLQDASILLQHLHEWPPSIRPALQETVLSMSRGMMYFMGRRTAGALRLTCLNEVNQYCFFVAGVVGELLTRLAAASRPEMDATDVTLVDAYHFGLFLQKVNLLKDQRTDELAGRYLIPSRDEAFFSLRENARRGFAYILSLPPALRSYRLFCSWSLFLGLASLPWIRKSWEEKSEIKIPRAETQTLLDEVELVIEDDEALTALFEAFFSFMPEGGQGPGGSMKSFPAFGDLYEGRLPLSQLPALGLITA